MTATLSSALTVDRIKHGNIAGLPDLYGWVGGGFAKLIINPRRRWIAYINFPITPPGDNELLAEFETRVQAAAGRGSP